MRYLFAAMLLLAACVPVSVSTTRGTLRVEIAQPPAVTIQPQPLPPLPTATPLPDWYYEVTPTPQGAL